VIIPPLKRIWPFIWTNVIFRHSSILRRIWLNFMALCLVLIRLLFQLSHFFFRISNFFDLSITEETWVVEMRIQCIKIVNVLVLHLNPWVKASTGTQVFRIWS
jgi:hypothetical protein